MSRSLRAGVTYANGAVRRGNGWCDSGPVFRKLPEDSGHFNQPYWPFVFRGLRTRAPQYVLDVEHGQNPPAWLTELVDGMVVVRL